MFKRCLVFVMALAMVLSLGMVGSFAAGLEDSLVMDVQFKADGVTDLKGHEVVVEDDPADGTSITLADGVLKIKGDENMQNRVIVKNVLNEDAPVEMTLELYVKLGTDDYDYDLFNLGNGNVNITPIGNGTQGYFGAGCLPGDCDTILDPGYPTGEWVHIVCVSDGETQWIYINGTYDERMIAGGGDNMVEGIIRPDEIDWDFNAYIGAFFKTAGRHTDFEMSICRYYQAAATEAEVAALYEAATSGDEPSPVIPSESPSEEPSESPSGEPSESPSVSPSNSPSGNSGKPGNAQTFDLGLVSLAAVALSSAVAVKKRR